ncbi:ATP-binding protein [bacterium]|nr:ATP-binding protein [bacterium]
MLLEFSVQNYLSFKEKQTLSMVASPKAERLEKNTFKTGIKKMPRALRSAVIYGPNASGKSNFLDAIQFMRSRVLKSSKESQAGEDIPTIPFLFDSHTTKKPGEFEIHFIKNNVRYQYGFSVSTEKVMSEWLMAYPAGRQQLWFERKYDSAQKVDVYNYGPYFKGQRKVWEESTRKNALFLSTAVQLNSAQLQPIYQWFKDLVTRSFGNAISGNFSAKYSQTNEGKKKLLRFLKKADNSIENIKVKTVKMNEKEIPEYWPDEMKKRFLKRDRYDIYMIHHRSDDEKEVALEYEYESEGTRRLFSIAGPLVEILEKGKIVFIDELNKSMHPLMVKFLIEQFHSSQNKTSHAQIIFTTHDTSLLETDIMRRDQIWFTEKNKENASELYPLTDFSPRAEASLEKSYLKGRYGALPLIDEDDD